MCSVYLQLRIKKKKNEHARRKFLNNKQKIAIQGDCGAFSCNTQQHTHKISFAEERVIYILRSVENIMKKKKNKRR